MVAVTTVCRRRGLWPLRLHSEAAGLAARRTLERPRPAGPCGVGARVPDAADHHHEDSPARSPRRVGRLSRSIPNPCGNRDLLFQTLPAPNCGRDLRPSGRHARPRPRPSRPSSPQFDRADIVVPRRPAGHRDLHHLSTGSRANLFDPGRRYLRSGEMISHENLIRDWPRRQILALHHRAPPALRQAGLVHAP